MTSRWHNRFGNIANDKADFIWQVLRNKNYSNAFEELVDMGYWSNNSIISDEEREQALYKEFIHYYNFIIELTAREFKELEFYSDKLTLINLIKLQLDKELKRIEKHDYESICE